MIINLLQAHFQASIDRLDTSYYIPYMTASWKHYPAR